MNPPIYSNKIHNSDIYSVSNNLIKSSYLLTSGMDAIISISDINSGKASPLINLVEHKGIIHKSIWHPTLENICASSSGDKSTKLWDIRQGNGAVKSYYSHKSQMMGCDFNKYVNEIALANSDGYVSIYDLRARDDVALTYFQVHKLACKNILFSPYFKDIFATISFDMNIRIWKQIAGKCVNLLTFSHHRGFVMGFDFSIFDAKKVISTGWDKTVYYFNWDQLFKS